ncbi:MAG: hypothetical protein ACKVP7_01030 [Hyphomicrobiaceae bacterium]
MQSERHDLRDDGLVPNNSARPLVVYRAALPTGSPERIIKHFAANGWSNAWVNGIYPFHHYHATAHEVLGLAVGWAEVQFGGASGPIVRVEAGDAVLIPAGVGHCRRAASGDLTVVGAYPGGADWDLQRATPEARLASLPLIARVPMWPRDPVLGAA